MEEGILNIKNKKMKQGIFIFFVLLLFVPFLQQQFKFTKELPLQGLSNSETYPEFNDSLWFAGKYQQDFEYATNKDIGFESFFLKLQCQINYSIYNISKAPGVIIGKNNVLFGKGYLDAINGNDFLGNEMIDVETDKMKVVQDELKKRNIDLFFVFAPGKASFDREYIPESMLKNTPEIATNYGFYKKCFNDKGINYLDLRSYFLSIKNTSKYPLYSITGLHWGTYGCVLAADSMAKYIERLRNIHLPKIQIKSIKLLDMAGKSSNDYDAASLMNVFDIIPHSTMAYPVIAYDTKDAVKPRFLCVTDSYFPGIAKTWIPHNIFTNYNYWLYNDKVYPISLKKLVFTKDLNIKNEIERRDVICVVSTELSNAKFPFGFIDNAYKIYAPHNKNYSALKLKELHAIIIQAFNNIYKNKKWKDGMIKTGKLRGVPKEQVFYENAMWLYNQSHDKD
jgi:hypothetical protein